MDTAMHIKFAKLPVADQDRAVDFYTKNLPCRVATDSLYGDDGWRWIELTFASAETTLMFHKRGEHEGDGEKPVLVLVDADLDTTVATLKENGVEIITEPGEAPWNPDARFAAFRDSEGNRLVLTTS
ncbi:VOC family protein [Marivita sp. S2033]|uniref:VOC family protein n=1 Tax=Marivita sp. S2033 TaxID=3373187 RepID=UPI0039827FA8